MFWIRRVDGALLVTTLALVCLGLLLVYSATEQQTAEVYRQLVALGVGLVLMGSLAAIDYEVWGRHWPWLYGGGLALLLLVLALGVESHGAQRWLALGPLRFQPSEPVKLVILVVLAQRLSQEKYLESSILLAVPLALIALQPDLGTAASIGLAALALLYLGGVNGWLLGAAAALAGTLGSLVLRDYQRERLLVFLDPERDPTGSGWNLLQSKIAVGSGQVWGQGLFHGNQKNLDFLPEGHTDFIFAVAAEELGFAGCVPILALLFYLSVAGLAYTPHCRERFGSLLAGGLSLYFAVHILVNVGMVIGVMPVTGLPLPFLSYGGTALVTNLAAIGLLTSVWTRRRYHPKTETRQIDERFAHLMK